MFLLPAAGFDVLICFSVFAAGVLSCCLNLGWCLCVVRNYVLIVSLWGVL